MNKTLITVGLAIAAILLIFPFIIYYGNDLMVATSDSMVPTLNPNDLLIVQRTEIDKITVGDIIVFDSHVEGIGIVAHRAIEKFDENGRIAINTQGDNIDEADTWVVHDEDLIGRVVGNISFIGILLIEPVRYMLVILIIITAISLFKEILAESKIKK
ncbi:MAG: signal peptidase I [Thaumarchaeota archaeon]|nr:signal peptidase I [Nitrososphaerota archaeon]